VGGAVSMWLLLSEPEQPAQASAASGRSRRIAVQAGIQGRF